MLFSNISRRKFNFKGPFQGRKRLKQPKTIVSVFILAINSSSSTLKFRLETAVRKRQKRNLNYNGCLVCLCIYNILQYIRKSVATNLKTFAICCCAVKHFLRIIIFVINEWNGVIVLAYDIAYCIWMGLYTVWMYSFRLYRFFFFFSVFLFIFRYYCVFQLYISHELNAWIWILFARRVKKEDNIHAQTHTHNNTFTCESMCVLVCALNFFFRFFFHFRFFLFFYFVCLSTLIRYVWNVSFL